MLFRSYQKVFLMFDIVRTLVNAFIMPLNTIILIPPCLNECERKTREGGENE